ncbi:MAG: hypothetical protein CVU43_12590 [Chloroflexi bacterium HGW-Chloroflexi-5]|jgi:hypothetical protein|nr:MAG: hypothetical protein CVU43_12590 [Chloroflexi bacterium HGW-Chloroflexi-5]PKP09846.1 MAG: hypothetical protein CVU09_09460 [Bacteroidetes bacterium HGW-Bacteroidetes-4]
MVSLNNTSGIINTFMGLEFNLFRPTPDMIDIRDIARGLAFKGRWAGQTPQYFSIAQHSVLVADLITNGQPGNIKLALAGLLHDAAESYLGDMITPLKKALPQFSVIEENILKAVFDNFKLPMHLMREVKPYDRKSLEMEFGAFYGTESLFPQLNPEDAYEFFLETFDTLWNGAF